jgi:hypothetical protein
MDDIMNRKLGRSLDKSHDFIHVNRTVATLLIVWEIAASAFC